MFFDGIMSKLATSIRPGGAARRSERRQSAGRGVSSPNVETRETRRILASAEEILRAEFYAAQAEFDLAKENPDIVPDIAVVRRYIQTMEKLKKFLAYGEVPNDVTRKLDEAYDKQLSSLRNRRRTS